MIVDGFVLSSTLSVVVDSDVTDGRLSRSDVQTQVTDSDNLQRYDDNVHSLATTLEWKLVSSQLYSVR